MRTSDYLRRQADNCLRIARTGFDLATAERLRHMASDLRGKADELDEQDGSDLSDDPSDMQPHVINGGGHRGSHDNGSGQNNAGGGP